MNVHFLRFGILGLASLLMAACAQKAPQDFSSSNPNNVGAELNLGTDLPSVVDVQMAPAPQDGWAARTGGGPSPSTVSREVCTVLETPAGADEAFFYVTFSKPMVKAQTQQATQIMKVNGDVQNGQDTLTPASASSVNFTWDTPDSSAAGRIMTLRVEGLTRNHTYVVQVGTGAVDTAGNHLDGRTGVASMPLFGSSLNDLSRPDDDFISCPSTFQSLAFSYCNCTTATYAMSTCPEQADLYYATLGASPHTTITGFQERTNTLEPGGSSGVTPSNQCLGIACADDTYLSVGGSSNYYAISPTAFADPDPWVFPWQVQGWQIAPSGRLVTIGAEFRVRFNPSLVYSRSGTWGLQATSFASNIELRDLTSGQMVPIAFSYKADGAWDTSTSASDYFPSGGSQVYIRPGSTSAGQLLSYSHVYQLRINTGGGIQDAWGNPFTDGNADGNDTSCTADNVFLVQFATEPDPARVLAENAAVRPYTLLPSLFPLLPDWTGPTGRMCTLLNGSARTYEVAFVVPHTTGANNRLANTSIDDRVAAGTLSAQNVILYTGPNGTGNPVPYDGFTYEDYTGDLFPDSVSSATHNSPSGVTQAIPPYQSRSYVPTTVLRMTVDTSNYPVPQSVVLSGRINVSAGGATYALDGNRDFIFGGYPAGMANAPGGGPVRDDVILPLTGLSACPR